MKCWPTKSLDDLILPTEQRDPREKAAEEFSYVDIAGVDNKTKTIVSVKRIVGAKAPSRARKIIRKGDVIVSTVRPNLNAVAFVPSSLDNEIASTGFSVLRPSADITSGYLFAFVRSPFFIKYLVGKTTGANYPAVNDSEVKGVPIPAPPLVEQERIVGLLDEADELRKLRALSDDRIEELVPALFDEMFGDLVENPKGYPIRPLEEVCTRITDGTHQPPKFSENGLPFLFVRNIIDGSIDFDTEKFITEETFTELTRRVRPERGDILYSTVGSYGVAVQVETDRKFAFQRHIGHLKPNRSKVDSGFLTAQLNTPWLKSQADQSARGIAQKTVNLAEIRKFNVLIPPLQLQKEFAKQVSEIRELEAEQAASRSRLDELFQSMLHRAFSGEL